MVSFSANLISMSYGSICGWPSAAYSVLQSNETPLRSGPMTVAELSWMVGFLCVGGFVGNIFFGCITNHCGRKLPILSLAIPITVCCMLIGSLSKSNEFCFNF